MPKGGKRLSGSSSKRIVKKMKSSCMWGGNSTGSGATGYGAAVFGDRGEQTNDGMGSNHIKLNDPALVWKGGQRGGSGSITIPEGCKITSPTLTLTNDVILTTPTTITWEEPAPPPTVLGADAAGQPAPPPTVLGADAAGQPVMSSGGSMLGAAIVPAALLAANQLYKPSRALKNLSFSRKNGFKRTMKKFRKGRR